ncbi:tyrosine-type recombinase/integrase [Agrobacterium vitis]|nr:tyrosine-type recombinase/integrase [Agrobacterium vitis]
MRQKGSQLPFFALGTRLDRLDRRQQHRARIGLQHQPRNLSDLVMAKPSTPKIRYVAWRNGRPRFNPSETLRARGHAGQDLKDEAGNWLKEAECRAWSQSFARQLEEEARQNRRKKPGRPRAATEAAPARRGLTLETLLENWLNTARNPDMADRQPNTIRDYRQKIGVIEKRAQDIWYSAAEALSKQICLGLYDKLRTECGLHTAHAVLRVLGIALQWGMDRGHLPSMLINPAHKLKMKTPPPRIRFATIKEIDHLVKVADAGGRPEMGDMVIFAVWSGQRQNDRLAFIHTGHENGRIKLRQGKTGALVSIPKAETFRVRIDAAMQRRKEAGVISPNVILDERRWQPFKADYYRHCFEDLRSEAAKTMPSLKTLRDQDLRDTAVTWLAMAGCTIPEICAITGHSFQTANEVMKHYLALNEELADSAMAKMVRWHEGESK